MRECEKRREGEGERGVEVMGDGERASEGGRDIVGERERE